MSERLGLAALAEGKKRVCTERKADVVEHERGPMKLSCWLSNESEEVVGTQEQEQDGEALARSNGERGLVKLYRTSGDDNREDIPEGDLTLPTRVTAPMGALCSKRLKDGLDDESRREADDADDEKDP